MNRLTNFSLEAAILHFDRALRVLHHVPPRHNDEAAPLPRPLPPLPQNTEAVDSCKDSIAIIRINHVGEICAQGLYHGQSLFENNPQCLKKLTAASHEEMDHLMWLKFRLDELQGRESLINPIWYGASFALGLAAGFIGRNQGHAYSMGFLAETERQVEQHLTDQASLLPKHDQRSAELLQHIAQEEIQHRMDAEALGATPMPRPIKRLMGLGASFMRWVARRI